MPSCCKLLLIPLLIPLLLIFTILLHPPLLEVCGVAVLELYSGGQEISMESVKQSLPLINPNRHYSLDLIPSLEGKVVVVTGGNSGVGFGSALQMAERGAVVIIGCRSTEKGREAVRRIRRGRDEEEIKVEFFVLDLSNFKSIRDFATTITQKYPKLNILMNNAGKLCEGPKTTEGFEPCFGVHLLGHAYLTFLLLPSLYISRPSRIVFLSSSTHYYTYTNGVDFGKLNSIDDPALLYGQSKLAVILFTRELYLQLSKIGVEDIFVNSVHPGFVATDLHWIFRLFEIWPLSKICYNQTDGALTQLYVATAMEIEEQSISGDYFFPIATRGVYGKHTSIHTLNDTLREELWKWTDKTINHFDPEINWEVLKDKLEKLKAVQDNLSLP